MSKNKRILAREVDQYINQTVCLSGWAQTIRTHAKVVFVDLRDRSGLTQLVLTNDLVAQVSSVTPESVLTVTGKVSERPQSMINNNVVSGKVEVQVEQLIVENLAKTLPFPLNDETVAEDTRLEYRYLDIRSKRMSDNLRMRHLMNQYFRDELTKLDFTEVETPYISKSTPEGARDYLVPSRISPGNFYALPQSPQQYKQLLMVGGLERYFQIVRCFRDEDARADRQPEFTQLDVELSFPEYEDVLNLIEQLFTGLVKQFFPEKILTFNKMPRLSYKEAIEEHHTDSPDLRKDKGNDDELAFALIVDFPLFEWKEGENRFDATHHPFTAPKPEYVENFEKKPKEALALQYDLVLNGSEIAGGSIRIHKPEVLMRVFKFMGHSEEKIVSDFGHLLDAFAYGAPPHGGFASGLDRLYAILLKEESIRDVIAFAKAGDGRDLMMHSPSSVEDDQLKELGIQLRK